MKPPGPNPTSRRRDLLLQVAVLTSCPLTNSLSTASDAGSLSYRAAAAASTTSVEPNSVGAAYPGRSRCAWLTAVVRAWSRCCCSVIALASSHPTVVPPNGGRVTASCTTPQNYTQNHSAKRTRARPGPEDSAIRRTQRSMRNGRAEPQEAKQPSRQTPTEPGNKTTTSASHRMRVVEAARRGSAAPSACPRSL